jgi:hypothetical protein
VTFSGSEGLVGPEVHSVLAIVLMHS